MSTPSEIESQIKLVNDPVVTEYVKPRRPEPWYATLMRRYPSQSKSLTPM